MMHIAWCFVLIKDGLISGFIFEGPYVPWSYYSVRGNSVYSTVKSYATRAYVRKKLILSREPVYSSIFCLEEKCCKST